MGMPVSPAVDLRLHADGQVGNRSFSLSLMGCLFFTITSVHWHFHVDDDVVVLVVLPWRHLLRVEVMT